MKTKTIRLKKNGIKRKITGIFLIFIGILGCLLPVAPGVIFIISGLSLISDGYSARVRRVLSRYKAHKKISKLLCELFFATFEEIKSAFSSKINGRVD